MEWIGWLSFLMVLYCYMYLRRVKILERKIKRLEKRSKGENNMSKLITSLVGEKCKIEFQDGIYSTSILEIMDADEEWVKTKEVGKKDGKIKLIRIDQIEKIEVLK